MPLLSGAEGQGVFYVDGVDLATIGFGIADFDAWWSGVRLKREHVSPYGALRSLPDLDGVVEPVVWRPSLVWAGERSERAGALDLLRTLLPWGHEVELRAGDSDRVAYGRREHDVVEVFVPAKWEYGDVVARMSITLYDPAKYDADETTTALSGDPVVVQVGTLPSDWEVDIDGAVTDPEVVVSAVEESMEVGAELYRFSLVGDVAAGDLWRIEFGPQVISLVPAVGDASNMLDALPVDGSEFRRLGTGAEASVAVHLEAAAGAPTGELRHRRRWG